MADLKSVIRDLVAGNRILAHENVVDAYGHISVRHPDNPNRYLLSRARSPELVEEADIMEFELDGTPVDRQNRPIYIERPIHGGIFKSRPDVMAVVHNHCPEILPFAITKTPMRAAVNAARSIGQMAPVWDIRDRFGDTDGLVTTNEQGDDLAKTLGQNRVVIMRGHGCAVASTSIPAVVQMSIGVQINAKAIVAGKLLGGEITYMTPGEVSAPQAGAAAVRGFDRAWEYLCRRAGVNF
jgi:ribulose-5-phosphate 4-epimerase/fuculose-1-phosphate aldolase